MINIHRYVHSSSLPLCHAIARPAFVPGFYVLQVDSVVLIFAPALICVRSTVIIIILSLGMKEFGKRVEIMDPCKQHDVEITTVVVYQRSCQ